MAFDVRLQNVFKKKKPVRQTVVWPLGLKNPGLIDRGVATRIIKFCMASGGLIVALVIEGLSFMINYRNIFSEPLLNTDFMASVVSCSSRSL